MTNRRAALAALIGGAALGVGAMWLGYGRTPRFDYAPIKGIDGFRRLAGQGDLSAAGVLAGLDPGRPIPGNILAQVTANPCAALFPDHPADAPLPVAVFTDHYCPNCRLVEAPLQRMQDDGLVRLHWHHLPILGPASEIAARATLAAGLQDAHDLMHQRLIGTDFRPTEAYLREAARGAGIDADQLLSDMADHPDITAHLDRARALAGLFAIPGTPALVIGRTLAIGRLSPRRLRGLVKAETGSGVAC